MQSCPKRYKLSWEYYDWSVVFKKKRSLQEALSFIWLCLERKHNYHDRQICNFFGFMSASNKIVSVAWNFGVFFMIASSCMKQVYSCFTIFFSEPGAKLWPWPLHACIICHFCKMIEKNQYCCRRADKSTRNRDGFMSNCQISRPELGS